MERHRARPHAQLLEHTHQLHGAKVLAADGRFVLHGRPDSWSHWILEIVFTSGFREFHLGTFERNAMRSPAHMRSVHLHWSGRGREAFERWLGLDKERAPTTRTTPFARSVLAEVGSAIRRTFTYLDAC